MYGILGENLPHTLSPFIHREIWNCQYRKWELEQSQAEEFFTVKQFDGINVTIPYKKLAYEKCDVLSETAKRVGCVNTVVNKQGKLFGYNTDYFGFYTLARSIDVDFYKKKVVILGSGGTYLTAKAVCEDNGAKEIICISRNGENNYSNISEHYDADIVINTTPVGMYPKNDSTIIDLSPFKNLTAVIDVIYNPAKTRLVMQAEDLGIKAAGGLEMLVAQAIASAELFSGKTIDKSKAEIVKKKIERRSRNIVLIGMPGCGKTTLGRIVGKILNKPFYDTDREIIAKEGMSVSEIFDKKGEEYFREIEGEVISELSKKSGCVIACGGGSILKNENRLNLRQNGRIYFINRKLDRLSTKGRPLSSGIEALKRLYSQRAKIYRSMCDKEIFSNQEIDSCASEIVDDFMN